MYPHIGQSARYAGRVSGDVPRSPPLRAPQHPPPYRPDTSSLLNEVLVEMRAMHETLRSLVETLAASSSRRSASTSTTPPHGNSSGGSRTAPGSPASVRPSPMTVYEATTTLAAIRDNGETFICEPVELQSICDACVTLGEATYASSNRDSPGIEATRLQLWDAGVGTTILDLLGKLPCAMEAAQAAQEGLLQTLANLFRSLQPCVAAMAVHPSANSPCKTLVAALDPAAMRPFAVLKLGRVVANLEWNLSRTGDDSLINAFYAALFEGDSGRWLGSLGAALLAAAADSRAAAAASKLLTSPVFRWVGM